MFNDHFLYLIMFLVFLFFFCVSGKQTTSLVISICGQIFLQLFHGATFTQKLMDRSTFAPLPSNEEPDYLLTLLVWRPRWMWHNRRGSQCQACGCSVSPSRTLSSVFALLLLRLTASSAQVRSVAPCSCCLWGWLVRWWANEGRGIHVHTDTHTRTHRKG